MPYPSIYKRRIISKQAIIMRFLSFLSQVFVVLVARIVSHQSNRRDFKDCAIALDMVRFCHATDRTQQPLSHSDRNGDPTVLNLFRYGAIPTFIKAIRHIQFNARRSQISTNTILYWCRIGKIVVCYSYGKPSLLFLPVPSCDFFAKDSIHDLFDRR